MEPTPIPAGSPPTDALTLAQNLLAFTTPPPPPPSDPTIVANDVAKLIGIAPADPYLEQQNEKVKNWVEFYRQNPERLSTGADAIRYGVERLPFVGPGLGFAFTMADNADMREAMHAIYERRQPVRKLPDGKELPEDYHQILAKAFVRAEQNQDQPWAQKVFDNLTQLPGFAIEFGATGGAYTAGRAAGAKIAGTGATNILGKAAQWAAPRAAGVAAQTAAASTPRILEEAAQRQAPKTVVEPGGEVNVDQSIESFMQDPEPFALSLGKAGLNQYIQMGSERSGGLLGQAGKAIGSKLAPEALQNAMGRLVQAWTQTKPGATMADAAKLLKQGGWDGLLQEMGEERVGEILSGLAGTSPNFGVTGDIAAGRFGQAAENLGAEAASLAAFQGLTGAGLNAAGHVNAAKQQMDAQDVASGAVRERRKRADQIARLKAEWAGQAEENEQQLADPNFVLDWVEANPEKAKAMSQLETPSRSEWMKYGPELAEGMRVRPGAQRKRFADRVRNTLDLVTPLGAFEMTPSESAPKPWMMTKAEFLAEAGKVNADPARAKFAHYGAVLDAIEQGEQVPDSVLADYPELRDQVEPPLAETEEPESVPEPEQAPEPAPAPVSEPPPVQQPPEPAPPPPAKPVITQKPAAPAPKPLKPTISQGYGTTKFSKPDIWEPTSGPVVAEVFQGYGRTDKDSIYEEGADGPVFGQASYWALSEERATRYGPQIRKEQVTLQNPYYLTNDEDLLQLAGVKQWPMSLAKQSELGKKIRSELESQGHDGVVINVPEYSDFDTNDKRTKKLRGLFSHSQIVQFNPSPASQAEEPSESFEPPTEFDPSTSEGSGGTGTLTKPKRKKRQAEGTPYRPAYARKEKVIKAYAEYYAERDPAGVESFRKTLGEALQMRKEAVGRHNDAIDFALGKLSPQKRNAFIKLLQENVIEDIGQLNDPEFRKKYKSLPARLDEIATEMQRNPEFSFVFKGDSTHWDSELLEFLRQGKQSEPDLLDYETLREAASMWYQKGVEPATFEGVQEWLKENPDTKAAAEEEKPEGWYEQEGEGSEEADPWDDLADVPFIKQRSMETGQYASAVPRDFEKWWKEGGEQFTQNVAKIVKTVGQPAGRAADWAATPAETKAGRKLLNQLEKDKRLTSQGHRAKVGIGDIARMIFDASKVLFIPGRSQVASHTGGHYMKKVGKPTEGLVHAIRQHTERLEASFHEGGHAFSTLLQDTAVLMREKISENNPTWHFELAKAIWPLLTRQGSRASDPPASLDPAGQATYMLEESWAEFVRLFVQDHTDLTPDMIAKVSAVVNELSPGIMPILKDAHRAYVAMSMRPQIEQWQANGFTDRQRKSGPELNDSTVASIAAGIIGPSVYLARLRRALWAHAVPDNPQSWIDFTGLWGTKKKRHSLKYRQQMKRLKETEERLRDTPGDLEGMTNWIQNHAPGETYEFLQTDRTLEVLAAGTPDTIIPEADREILEGAGFVLPVRKDKHEVGMAKWTNLKSIAKIRGELGSEWKAFGTWLMARSAYETWKKSVAAAEDPALKKLFRLEGKPKPKVFQYPGWEQTSPAELEKIIENGNTKEKWQSAAKDMRAFFDAALMVAYMSGEFTAQELVAMREHHVYYAPLRREFSADPRRIIGAGRGGPESRSGIRGRGDGGTEPYLSLDDQIEIRLRGVLRGYYANLQAKSFTEFIKGLNENVSLPPEARRWAGRLMIPLHADTKRLATMEQHQLEGLYAKLIDRIQRHWAEKEGVAIEDLPEEYQLDDTDLQIILAGMPRRVGIYGKVAPNVPKLIATWDNGKQQYWMVTDMSVWALMQASSQPHKAAETFAMALRDWAQANRRSAVSRLGYIMAAPFRDIASAFFLGQGVKSLAPGYYLYKTAMNRILPSGHQLDDLRFGELLVHSVSDERRKGIKSLQGKFMDMVKEGPIEDYVRRWGDMTNFERALRFPGFVFAGMMKPQELLNRTVGMGLSSKLETAPRKGAALAEAERGGSIIRQQLAADRVTGYFAQRGMYSSLREVQSGIPFANAHLQLFYQTMIEPVLHPDPEVRAMYFAVKMPLAGAIAAAMAAGSVMLIYAMYDDDEAEEIIRNMRERPLKERSKAFAFMGKIRIPMDDGPMGSIMFASVELTERALLDEKLSTRDRKLLAQEIVRKAAETPGLTDAIPIIPKLPLELWGNRSIYNDQEITPSMLLLSEPDPTMQHLPDTPESYKWLSKMANKLSPFKAGKLNPLEIQHISKSIFTYALQDLLQAVENVDSIKEMAEIPLIGSLFVRTPKGMASQPMHTLQDMDLQYQALASTLEMADKRGEEIPPEAREKLERLSYAHAAMLRTRRIKTEINQLEKQIPRDDDKIRAKQMEMRTVARTLVKKIMPVVEPALD